MGRDLVLRLVLAMIAVAIGILGIYVGGFTTKQTFGIILIMLSNNISQRTR